MNALTKTEANNVVALVESPPLVANDNGRMTAAQLAELDDLMIRTRTPEGKLLADHKLDFRSIQQVPASDYVRLKNALLLRVNVLHQRAAAAKLRQNGDRS